MLRVGIEGLDFTVQRLSQVPGQLRRATNSALASIGYRLKQEAKTAVQANTLGWPSLSYPTLILRTARPDPNYSPVSRSVRSAWKNAGVKVKEAGFLRYRRATNPSSSKMWGQLGGLASYRVAKDQGFMDFGFMAGMLGKKASGSKNTIGQGIVNIALKLTEGSQITVTRDMQRFLAGLGFYRRIGSIMKIPGRPLVIPVFERVRDQIPAWFKEKLTERLKSYGKGQEAPVLEG